MYLLLALVSLIGFLVAFLSHGAGWFAAGIAIGFIAAIAAVFALAAARIDSNTREETLSDAEIEALRRAVKAQSGTGERVPPPA